MLGRAPPWVGGLAEGSLGELRLLDDVGSGAAAATGAGGQDHAPTARSLSQSSRISSLSTRPTLVPGDPRGVGAGGTGLGRAIRAARGGSAGPASPGPWSPPCPRTR